MKQKSPRIPPVDRLTISDVEITELELASGGPDERWNVFETVAHNPEVFAGLRKFRESMDADLTPKEHEVIALEMARQNGCGYCLPAHVYLCRMYGIGPETIESMLQGEILDTSSEYLSLRKLVRALVETRGHLSDAQLEAARTAGFTDRKIISVIAVIAYYTMMNYTNRLAGTEIEEPVRPHIPDHVNWVTQPDR